MKKSLGVLGFALVVIIILLANSLYTVNQYQKAIELRFNKVVRTSAAEGSKVELYGPGLHFKIPFITRVVKMDTRLQTLDDQPDRFLTSEKKDVIIDSYVKWKISDFDKFYTTTGGSIDKADSLLRRVVNDQLRSQVAQQTIVDLVSGSRTDIMKTSLEQVNENKGTTDLGVKVIDVRINKIELPDEVSNSIYARMRAERIAIAGEHRAKGQQEAQTIRARTDRDVQIIIAEAKLNAVKTQAEADQKANEIYNTTYAQSLDLFNFLQTLNAYAESLKANNTVLVFNPKQDSLYQDLFSTKLITTTDKAPVMVSKPVHKQVIKPAVEPKPVVKPAEVKPLVKPTEEKPAVKPAEEKPAVKPTEEKPATPAEKPATPAEKPATPATPAPATEPVKKPEQVQPAPAEQPSSFAMPEQGKEVPPAVAPAAPAAPTPKGN